MKHLYIILIFLSTLISSKIMDATLSEIKILFPDSKSIIYSKYKIPKQSIKYIQNNVKQKFFRPEVNTWTIISKDSLKYYAILDNVKGKSLPITFLTIFDDSSRVYYNSIIKYRESYGGEISSKNWLNQFNAYTDLSKYKVGDDISNITGATISVNSITKGIRKLSYLIYEIIKDNE